MKKIRRTINSPKKHYLVCMNLNFPMTDLSAFICKLCPEHFLINETKQLQNHLQKTHSIICNGSMKMSDHAIKRTIFTHNYSCKYHKNCSFIASNAMSLMNHCFFYLKQKHMDTEPILRCITCFNKNEETYKIFTYLEYLKHVRQHILTINHYQCSLPSCCCSSDDLNKQFILEDFVDHLTNYHKLTFYKIERCSYLRDIQLLEVMVFLKKKMLMEKHISNLIKLQ